MTANAIAAQASTPPMLPGLPLLGNALDFRRDVLGLFRRGYERFGPVFGMRLALQPAVVLVGREHTRFFFESTDDVLSMSEVYQFLVPIIGGQVAFAAPRAEYQEQRRIMLPAFHGKKLGSYVHEMQKETLEWMDTLGDEGRFELTDTAEHLTMAVIARAILGEPFRRTVGKEFVQMFRDLAGGLEFLLPTNLPLPRFIRRDRARKKLRALIGDVVRRRRADRGQHDDFLEVLLDATYLGHERMPDEDVVTMILGLVFGGRENTSGHLEWSLIQLLQHPDVLSRARAEVDGVVRPGEALTPETLKGLPWLGWCIKESERLRPVTHTLVRLAARDFEIGGHHVPKGWLAVAAIALTQRLPELFRDPERYDPGRYAPGRDEDQPYAITGFGGGFHKCWATAFVLAELKVILGLLIQRFELRLADPEPPTIVNDIGVTRPRSPCFVHYRRR